MTSRATMLVARVMGAALGLGAAVTAPAQRAPATPTAVESAPTVLSPLVVTGTRLSAPANSVAVPVVVLGSGQIASSGVTTDVLDILRKTMPQFAGNANLGLENAGNVAFFSMGGSALSIHNLSTLTLINGRRVAFDPAAAGVGNEFVDVNMIPPSAIDRIEILADGASALYGSDAVGGVVNLILRSNFNGWEAGAHWGESGNRGHYTERAGYLTGGVSDDRTSLLLSVEGTKSSPVFMSQRPYTNPIYGIASYPGIIDVVSFQTGADTFYRLNPAVNAPPRGGQYTVDQLVQMGVYMPQSPEAVIGGYNLADAQTLIASLTRKSVVATLEHKLAGDRLVLFGDLIYAVTNTESSIHGQTISAPLSTPFMDFAQFGMTPPPPGFPYLPAGQANSPFLPDWIDQGNLVTVHNLFADYPVRTEVKSDFVRAVAGLRGALSPRYSWEAAANLNRYLLAYRSPGQIDTAALNAALAAGTLNPFAYAQPAGALPAGIIGTRTNDMRSTLVSFDALVHGTPAELPGGPVSFAAGASFTREHLEATPDPNSLPNAIGIPGWLGFQSFSPFNASRNLSSAYAELKLPLVGPVQHRTGVDELSLTLAGREDRYSGIGGSGVPQAALLYRPVDEQVTFRASAGKSFSAPTLYELYGPVQSGQIPPVTFLAYGTGQPLQAVFNGFSGSNPNLDPARATTWSAGFVLAPHALEGLSVSFDYFSALDKGEIGYLSVPAIVQNVESFGPASPYAQYVHLGGPDAPGVTGPGQLSTTSPSGVFVQVPLINLASQAMKGFDAALDWTGAAPGKAGRLALHSAVTVFSSYQLQAIPTEGYFQYAGHASGGSSSSQGTIPRWRNYTTLEWKHRQYVAFLGYTYVPSVTDIGPGGDAATPPAPVGAYQQVDVNVSYDFGHVTGESFSSFVLRLGVTNLFNRMPPIAPNAFPSTNADVGTYNGAVGRLYLLDAVYRF